MAIFNIPPIKNKYKVPVNLWKKFKTQASKKLYNDVMDQMMPNQHLTIHPKTPKIPAPQWGTLCHNAACYAVWATEGHPLKEGDNVEIVSMKTGKRLKLQKAK